jgi:dihydrofolate reductase
MTRKVVVQMQVSFDGFVGAKDGSVEWAFPAFDKEFTALSVAELWQAAVHIMGAETGRGLAAYWPAPTEERDLPFAQAMNEIPKVVFSKTIEHLDWNQTTIAKGDLAEEIDRLREDDDKWILAHGGARFVQSLARRGLVDEYHVIVHPVALGSGLSLFPEMETPMRMEVIETRPLASGCVLHVMKP